jgi:hypothetical protein
MRTLLVTVRLAAAVVALMLAAGPGLSGLVRTVSGANEHVCTCASGGSHASCPVCSHSLRTRSQSHSKEPVADGTPCGDPRIGVVAGREPGAPPPSFALVAPRVTRLAAPRFEQDDLDERFLEPATPPPRFAST